MPWEGRDIGQKIALAPKVYNIIIIRYLENFLCFYFEYKNNLKYMEIYRNVFFNKLAIKYLSFISEII